MTRTMALLGVMALALAGCKGEQKKTVGGTAQGEVLPGSVSDAMLPLDTVTSQPPLAPKSEGGDGKGEAKSDKASSAPRPAQPDKAEPEPVEAPAPDDAPVEEQ